MNKNLSYRELIRLPSFEERYEYLKLGGVVGRSTFGFDRWINQRFYSSREWKLVRNAVITRDRGCDLGVEGFEIFQGLIVHHINPMSMDDFTSGNEFILDVNNLISTSHQTHNAIHFGDANLLPRGPIERVPGDTTLW